MENPYQSSIHGGAPPPPSVGGGVTIATVQGLAATKPWIRFCAILGFILGGLMVLFGLLMMVSMAFISMSGKTGAQETGVMAGVGAVYLLMSALYLIPSFRLWKYGSAILSLMMSGSVTDLDRAMEHHRSFWKFVGILMILGTVVSVLMILGGFVTATSAIKTTP